MANTPIRVIDIMGEFPDLAEDLAITDLETVKKFIKERLNLPKEKANIYFYGIWIIEGDVKFMKETINNDFLTKNNITIENEQMPNGENRFRVRWKDLSGVNITNSPDNPDWQNAHYH